jgi:hypothetical protein
LIFACSLALFFLIALAANISIDSRHGLLGIVSELKVFSCDACRLLGVEMTTQSWDSQMLALLHTKGLSLTHIPDCVFQPINECFSTAVNTFYRISFLLNALFFRTISFHLFT